MAVEKQADGTMRSSLTPRAAQSGLCALDLYFMELIGPEEVPDTFFISGAIPDGKGGLTGGEAVTVRM
jgi:hypothetical protein